MHGVKSARRTDHHAQGVDGLDECCQRVSVERVVVVAVRGDSVLWAEGRREVEVACDLSTNRRVSGPFASCHEPLAALNFSCSHDRVSKALRSVVKSGRRRDQDASGRAI